MIAALWIALAIGIALELCLLGLVGYFLLRLILWVTRR